MKALALLFLTATFAQARIGETREGLILRYGQPKSEDRATGQLVFVEGGTAITAQLWQGKCHLIEYSRRMVGELKKKIDKEKKILPKASFSKEKIDSILSRNPEGSKWVETGEPHRRQT